MSGHFTLLSLANRIASIWVILSPEYDIVAKGFPTEQVHEMPRGIFP
ncbi:MAG: hypothetical protein ACI9MF_002148 [Gammaproteobacteria bacterium]